MTIAQAIELPGTLQPALCPENVDRYILSEFLYCSGLDLLPIPSDFAEGTKPDRDRIGFI
jgi:hypothetical protein